MANLDADMEREIEDLRRRYHAKRQVLISRRRYDLVIHLVSSFFSRSLTPWIRKERGNKSFNMSEDNMAQKSQSIHNVAEINEIFILKSFTKILNGLNPLHLRLEYQ